VQYKIKSALFIFIAEPQPILSEAKEAQGEYFAASKLKL
jgi:hypothetical protein